MKATSIFGKIFVLILVFTLGFLSCVGALLGGGYYVYSKLTLDHLGVDTSKVLSEEAEKDLTAMSLAQLIAEFSSLNTDSLSIEVLTERYGLILPKEIADFVTEDVKKMGLKDLFSKDGVVELLSDLYFGKIFGYERKDDPSAAEKFIWVDENGKKVVGVNSVLADITVGELLDGGIPTQKIMDELSVGELMELEAKENLPIYVENANGDLIPAEGVDPIVVWYNGSGEQVASIIGVLANKSVNDLTTGIDDIALGDVFGTVAYLGKSYTYDVKRTDHEFIVLTEAESVVGELSDLTIEQLSGSELTDRVNGMQISDLLGYEQDAETGVWKDSNGKELNAIMAKLADSTVGTINSTVDSLTYAEIAGLVAVDENGDVIADIENYEGEITWFEEGYVKGGESNKKADSIMVSLAELSVSQMSDSDEISDAVKEIVIGDAMGYVKDGDVWYTDDTKSQKASNIIAILADSTVGDMNSRVDMITFAEIAGLEKAYFLKATDAAIAEEDVENYDESEIYFIWVDENGKKTSGLMAGLTHLTVEDFGNEDRISDAVGDIAVGDAMGYEKVDGIWYTEYDKTQPEKNQLEGLVKAIADSKVENLNGDMQTMKFGTVAGLTYDEATDQWMDGTEVATGINAALADLTVGEMSDSAALSEAIQKVTVADAMNYTKTTDGYEDADGNEVESFMAVIADKQISDIQETLDKTPIGKFMGYEQNPANGNKWEKEGVEADGLMQKVCGRTIDGLDGLLSDLVIKDVIDNYDEGIFSFVDENTKITKMSDAFEDLFNDVENGVTMGELEDAKLINLGVDDHGQPKKLSNKVRAMTFAGFMQKAHNLVDSLA